MCSSYYRVLGFSGLEDFGFSQVLQDLGAGVLAFRVDLEDWGLSGLWYFGRRRGFWNESFRFHRGFGFQCFPV